MSIAPAKLSAGLAKHRTFAAAAGHSVGLGISSLITYLLVTHVLAPVHSISKASDLLGGMHRELLHLLSVRELAQDGHASAGGDRFERDDAANRLEPRHWLAVISGEAVDELDPAGRVERVDPPPAVVHEVLGPGHVVAALSTGLEFVT